MHVSSFCPCSHFLPTWACFESLHFLSNGISEVFLKTEKVISWPEDKASPDALQSYNPGCCRAGISICSAWIPPCSDPSLLIPSSPWFLIPPPSSADSLGTWIILRLSRAIHRSKHSVSQSWVFQPFLLPLGRYWLALVSTQVTQSDSVQPFLDYL